MRNEPNWPRRAPIHRRSLTLLRIPNSAFSILVWLCALVIGCAKKPVAGLVVAPLLGLSVPQTLFTEPFHILDEQRWHEIEVKGRTQYVIEELDGSRSLKARSRAGASILLCPFRFNPDTYEWLSWRWRVDQFVDGEDLTTKAGSDAAARVYVYFDTPGMPWQKRSLDYVWSSSLPVGTMLSSAYSQASKIIVVESGIEHRGKWRTVSRNIEEDYRRCFGEDPADVVAIGVMTDADSTHTEAVAYFDDLMITREKPLGVP